MDINYIDMTQEEVKQRFAKENEELCSTVIPTITNAAMDAFQRGVHMGLEMGTNILLDKATEYLKENGCWNMVDEFRKAMTE